MAAYLGLSTVIRNEIVQRVQVNMDLGAGAATMKLYDGTRPATGGAATTLGVTLTFSDPVGPSASGGVFTASAITPGTAVANITTTWGRLADSTGTFCGDFNCGTSAADLILNSTTISTGVQVSCSTFTLTAGNT